MEERREEMLGKEGSLEIAAQAMSIGIAKETQSRFTIMQAYLAFVGSGLWLGLSHSTLTPEQLDPEQRSPAQRRCGN